jgi:hypothetical protein
LLVSVPASDWDDVRQVEQYVRQQLQYAGPPDRRCIGVLFSGYRPDAANREERIFALRLGAVAGGWDAVYRGIGGSRHPVRSIRIDGTNGHDRVPVTRHVVAAEVEDMA